MKRILITGALGHIGSYFIHSLRPGDFEEVVMLDNMSTQRYCSLFNLPGGVPFRFVEEDILTANLEYYMENMDAVIHLAAITNAAGSFDIQEKVEQVNFEGTRRVAQACLVTGCKMIFLSTTSVYGTQNEIVDENCSPEEIKPQSPYATSKLRAEQLLQSLGQNDKLRYIICRFGTIYGTSIGMRFHTAINKFIWQAILGQPLTVWRTALHQKRPYLELGDAVRALRFILEKDLINNELYNVLTDNATVNDIVTAIKEFVPELQVSLVDSQIMNQLSYEVDNQKFRNLGFSYHGNLVESISQTVKLLRNSNQA